jgi:hypothetical protein
MPRPLMPDTDSRVCTPTSLQPFNRREKECCAGLTCGIVTDVVPGLTVSDNEPLETFAIQLSPAEKMNAR